MRIIKEGRKPPKEIEVTCEQCGCIFAYERKDLQCSRQYNNAEYWVECPTCKKMIFVEPFPKY